MGGMQRPTTDGTSSRPHDSWIEIASQPSSSSLSSAAPDDIDATGLRVQHDSNSRARRRPRNTRSIPLQMNLHLNRSDSAGGSSQEEYEESESESDRVMSSSNEGLPASDGSPADRGPSSVASDEIVEDDDDGTMLGIRGNQQCFTPQPNAFSHPPSSTSRATDPVPGSYFPASRPEPQRSRSEAQRHSYPDYQGAAHRPRNAASSSYHTDHDAALRASLSTLLSCAAARRPPRPSHDQEAKLSSAVAATGAQRNNRVDPSTLRMVPEAEVIGEESEPAANVSDDATRRATSTQDKGKRKASTRSTSKDRARAAKKLRAMQSLDESISPTLFTWVVSAGVLVLASALSFSAGYAVGKDAGRAEAAGLNGWVDDEVLRNCSKEAIGSGSGLGLRRTLRSVHT